MYKQKDPVISKWRLHLEYHTTEIILFNPSYKLVIVFKYKRLWIGSHS